MKKNLMKLITLALMFMLLAAVPGKPAEATFTFGSASSQEKTEEPKEQAAPEEAVEPAEEAAAEVVTEEETAAEPATVLHAVAESRRDADIAAAVRYVNFNLFILCYPFSIDVFRICPQPLPNLKTSEVKMRD